MSAASLDYTTFGTRRSSLGSDFSRSQNYSSHTHYPRLNYTITVPVDHRLEPIVQRATLPVVPEVNSRSPLIGPIALNGTRIVKASTRIVRRITSIFQRIYGTNNSRFNEALGMTNLLNFGLGPMNIQKGFKDQRTARENGDVNGVALGCLKMLKGGINTVAEAVYVPSLALSFAKGSIRQLLGTLKGLKGSCGYASSAVSSIVTGIQCYELWRFNCSLDAVLKDPQISQELRSARALEFLKQEIAASPENRAFIKRVVSEKCLKMIQEKGIDEAPSVIDAVKQEMERKTFINGLTSIGLVLTAIPLVVAVGPTLLLVSEVASLLLSLTWMGINVHNLHTALVSGESGEFDKQWLLISSALSVAAIGLAFFFSAGAAHIVTAAIVGSLWLAVNAVSYYRLDQQPSLAENPRVSLA